MAVTITHNTVADGDPLIDGDDWNANHTITGGGTFRIPQLIESKTAAAGATTLSFTSLTGNSVTQYFIRYDGILSISDAAFRMNFNGDTGNNYVSGSSIQRNSGDLQAYGSTAAYILIGGTPWSTTTPQTGIDIFINPVSGVRRIAHARAVMAGSNYTVQMFGYGQWTNTADEMTSITFTPANGSFSGVFSLYKLVEITI